MLIHQRYSRSVLLFNAAAEKIVGKSEKEVIGSDDSQLFSMEEAMAVMSADREIMSSEKSITLKERITECGRGIERFFNQQRPDIRYGSQCNRTVWNPETLQNMNGLWRN